MKKIFTFLTVLTITIVLTGQAPLSFKYQAVLRDARGNIKANASVSVIISILQGSATGSAVYSETHSATTDVYGIMNLEIGTGTVNAGSFSGINWDTGIFFIKVAIDGVEMGTSQLLSVPYALYASEAGNSFGGSYNDLSDKPVLFDGTWTSLSGKPNSLDGFGITDAATTGYVDSLKQEIKLEIYAELGVTDADGNSYKAVKIGFQVWMAENLKTTKYNDGTAIPLVPDAWAGLTTPAYCWQNNDGNNKNIYGALYNWYTVNTGKLCPAGWHVPSDAEWTVLTAFLGGESIAGGKLKATGTTHWTNPNTGATNETDFTALAGGSRTGEFGYGTGFSGTGYNGLWWSATIISGSTVWRRFVTNSNIVVTRDFSYKFDGLSVRCLKN